MPNLTPTQKQAAYDSGVENVSKFSARISELCKIVWAGALAIFYALVTAEPGSAATKFIGTQRTILFAAAVAGSLALLFDYLQNISAYVHASRLTAWIARTTGTIPAATYNAKTKDFWACANTFFFGAKNVAVLVTAVLVAYVILAAFLR
jgi:hypothetical protein